MDSNIDRYANIARKQKLSDTPPANEIPATLRELAEMSVERARHSFSVYFDAARHAIATLERHPAAAFKTHEIARHTLSYTEDSIRAALHLAERLVHARDVFEASQIHSEHLKNRASALLRRVQDFNESFRNSEAAPAPQQVGSASESNPWLRSTAHARIFALPVPH